MKGSLAVTLAVVCAFGFIADGTKPFQQFLLFAVVQLGLLFAAILVVVFIVVGVYVVGVLFVRAQIDCLLNRKPSLYRYD